MTNRALTVGINAYASAPLSGCVNDAMDWRGALQQRGYYVGTLLDENATKETILDALRTRVAASRFGDRLVFQYSGHGSWVPDLSGDEPDRRDEVLCAIDYENGGLITDDELAEVFAQKRFGVRIMVISDSCHSGSVNRFADIRDFKQPRFLAPSAFLDGADLDTAYRHYVRSDRQVTVPRNGTGTLLLSGCADEEYSYDAYINGRYNGAFTRVALDVLEAYRAQYGRDPSMTVWHKRVRAELPSRQYGQSPQMYASLWQRGWRL